MKNIILFTIGTFIFLSAKASEQIPPASNTDCNSALAICDLTNGHNFNNNVNNIACGSTFINQYYFFYTTGNNFLFDVNFTSNDPNFSMSGFKLYGPMQVNLPDACEQLNSNSAFLITSSNSNSSTYSVSSGGVNPGPGLFILVIKMDVCFSGNISFSPVRGNYTCTPEIPCENCIPSFELMPDKKYMISLWTKEDNAPVTKTSYDLPSASLVFKDGNAITGQFTFNPSGMIIDGWQRIEGEFLVPINTDNMELKLEVASGEAYFDDIRIFPFDGSMKSYVYDPITLRLMAELDERNYATIYEYDEEGKLVRVKKETERGVMTIQENKTFIKKE